MRLAAVFLRKCAKFVQKHPQKKEEQERHQGHADFCYYQTQELHRATCTGSDIDALARK